MVFVTKKKILHKKFNKKMLVRHKKVTLLTLFYKAQSAKVFKASMVVSQPSIPNLLLVGNFDFKNKLNY